MPFMFNAEASRDTGDLENEAFSDQLKTNLR
jgi:hypothetical protein